VSFDRQAGRGRLLTFSFVLTSSSFLFTVVEALVIAIPDQNLTNHTTDGNVNADIRIRLNINIDIHILIRI
jgi:hypothetical protein